MLCEHCVSPEGPSEGLGNMLESFGLLEFGPPAVIRWGFPGGAVLSSIVYEGFAHESGRKRGMPRVVSFLEGVSLRTWFLFVRVFLSVRTCVYLFAHRVCVCVCACVSLCHSSTKQNGTKHKEIEAAVSL